jgi:phenylacetate-CoA ligase
MLDTLRYFGSREDGFPEWRELSHARSTEDVWKHWSALPIVTKKDLQERFAPEELKKRFAVEGKINTSGGSTGTPTRFVWDVAAQEQKSALQYYCWRKLGWKPGMPVMSLWGSPRDLGQAENPRTRLLRQLRDVTIIDGYEFNQQTVEVALNAIQSHKRIAVYGYTTLLEQFAREIIESGRQVQNGKVATAWSGAEPLRDEQSDLFRQAFGVPIHNQYGGREFGAIAYKLDGQSSFNLFRPVVFLEIVNDKNEPCAPGETGRILLTTLIGRGTPFIRYENGDLGTYSDFDMTEAGLIGMSSVDGRTTSLIHLPDGRTFHSVFWHQLFKDYGEIKGFHVHQNADGSIDIVYIGQPFSTETGEALNRLIGNMLGGVRFSISRVEKLPKTAQGKHLQVTSDFHPSR